MCPAERLEKLKSQLVGDDLQSKFMEISTLLAKLTSSQTPLATPSAQIRQPVDGQATSRTLNKSKVIDYYF